MLVWCNHSSSSVCISVISFTLNTILIVLLIYIINTTYLWLFLRHLWAILLLLLHIMYEFNTLLVDFEICTVHTWVSINATAVLIPSNRVIMTIYTKVVIRCRGDTTILLAMFIKQTYSCLSMATITVWGFENKD